VQIRLGPEWQLRCWTSAGVQLNLHRDLKWQEIAVRRMMNRTGFLYVLEKHSEGDRAPDCQEEIMDPALTPRCHRTV
jgi:hypothetical protein